MTKLIGRRVIAIVVTAGLLSGCGTGNGGQPGSVVPSADGSLSAVASPSAAPSTAVDNGVAALSPDKALARAKAALKAAKSYRMKGNVDDSGKTIALDFEIAGSDMGGQLSMDGAKVELLSVGGKQFIRPDKKFWEQVAGPDAGATMSKLMGSNWALLSAKDKKDFAQLFGLANVDELFKPTGKLTKGKATEINGAPAIALDDSGSKLYIATTGEPYPLKMAPPGTQKGELTFSDFGSTFADLKLPPDSQVVDLDKLKG